MLPSTRANRCRADLGLTWRQPTQVRSGSGRAAATLRGSLLRLRGKGGLGAFDRRLDIDPPPGQLGRQAGVLPVLSNRKGQLILRNMGGGGARFLVDLD